MARKRKKNTKKIVELERNQRTHPFSLSCAANLMVSFGINGLTYPNENSKRDKFPMTPLDFHLIKFTCISFQTRFGHRALVKCFQFFGAYINHECIAHIQCVAPMSTVITIYNVRVIRCACNIHFEYSKRQFFFVVI